MKVMITGMAGFVGYHLAATLAQRGFEVTGVDSLTDYYPVSLKESRLTNLESEYQIRNYRINLSNKELAEELFQKIRPDVVVHLAAQPGVRLPVDKYSYYVENNLLAFFNVASLAVGNSCKSFIYASSSSVYGNTSNSVLDEGTTHTKPISFYGSTKLSNEILADTLFSNSSTKALGLRFFTVYGEYGRPDMAYFKILSSLLTNDPFKLFGDGLAVRDFTYVQDVTNSIRELIDWTLISQRSSHEIVNIGGGNPYSMNKMIEVMENITGRKLELIRQPAINGDVLRTCASTKKLEQMIGSHPTTQLTEGLEKFISWATADTILPQFLRKWSQH
jgi:UDP-glucuronate 4-epimerase